MTLNAQSSSESATNLSEQPQQNQSTEDYGDYQQGNPADGFADQSEAMGDAVREVEQRGKQQKQTPPKGKGQPTQKQVEQMFELRNGKYTKSQLEKELENADNYKRGMHQAYEKAAKVVNNFKQLKDVPIIDAMKRMGKSDDQIEAELVKYAERRIQQSQMTPEQRELEQLRGQTEQQQQYLKQLDVQRRQYAMEQMTQQEIQKYNETFKSHVESKGLPYYNPLDMREMAHLIHGNLEKGIEVDWDEAADQLVEYRSKSTSAWLEKLAEHDPSGKLLIKHLPKKVVDTIRSYSVNQVKNVGRQQGQARPASAAQLPQTPKKLSIQEWRERLKQIN